MPKTLWLTAKVPAQSTFRWPDSGKLSTGNQRVPDAFVVVGIGDSDRRLERRS